MPDEKRMKNPEFAAGYNAAMAEVREALQARKTSKKAVKTIRCHQLGINRWNVVEEVRYGEADEAHIILAAAPTSVAEDEVRLYYEKAMGPNRLGDSGMPW